MKLTRRHVVTGIAATGLVAAGLAASGAALASAGPPAGTPAVVAAAPASPSYGPGAGYCGGGYGMRAGQQPVMTAAAGYLGLSLTQLRAQLQAGNSLADVARAQGKPVSGLENAILAAMTSRINANTALTAQQRAALINQVKSHLDAMIDMDHGMGRGMGPHMTGAGSPMGGMWS